MDQQQQSRWRPTKRQLQWALGIVAVLTIAVLIGYRYDITLWDWIKLLVVPVVIAGVGIWFNRQQQKTWSTSLKDTDKLDQLKLVYDYVKFHIQLYLATPAALALVADGLQVKQDRIFTFGLIGMILVYLAAGIHAGLFMGRHVNDPRQDDFLERFEQDAFSSGRIFMHHSLYWLGLAIGLGCLALSAARKYL